MSKLIIIILIVCLLCSLSALFGQPTPVVKVNTEGFDPFPGNKYYSYRGYSSNPYNYRMYSEYPFNYKPYSYYQKFDNYFPEDLEYGGDYF